MIKRPGELIEKLRGAKDGQFLIIDRKGDWKISKTINDYDWGHCRVFPAAIPDYGWCKEEAEDKFLDELNSL